MTKQAAGLHPALDAPVEELHPTLAGALRYYIDRSGAGRPLLLLHSINAAPSAIEIKPLFDAFRGQRTVVAPDLPGFGLSDRRDIEYTPELYAGVLAALIRHLDAGAVDVVALSTTSEFAARCALQGPDLCNSLALISPTGLGERNPPGKATQARIKRFLSPGFFGQGLFRLLTTRRSIRFFLNKSFHGETPVPLIDYAEATARQAGARFAPFCFLSGSLFTSGARAALYERVAVPGLVIYDQDANVSFEQLPALLENSPCWRAERIAPTRGMPHWEQTTAVCAALEAFWDDAG